MRDTNENKYEKLDEDGNRYLLQLNKETKELEWVQVIYPWNEI
tara:strand:- start:3707 stop:3835 length:129 start_codon:yes stop_codon:yes gene_type:complete